MLQVTQNRILVVDDNPAIHDDIRKILAPPSAAAIKVAAVESALFGEQQPGVPQTFEIDSAFQGDKALRMVQAAQNEGRPYALAFVDIRMPPGNVGVETIGRLWEIAPDLQIVLCTAYSDYSWQEIAGKVAAPHNMVVLKKPFENIEVLQLAHALTHKWLKTQEADAQLETLNAIVAERTRNLRESDERFRTFMNNSPAVAFIKDARGRYTYLNRPFKEQFGISVDDGVLITDKEIWPAEIAAELRENDQIVYASGEAREFAECMPLPGESHAEWLVLKFPIHDAKGERFIGGVGVNMTDRIRLEAERRQSHKLEAVGQLAGGVAHDFNNILGVIIGYTETALTQPPSEEKLGESLEEIMKAAERGTTLIRQLLGFSRKQASYPRVIDVNPTIIDIDRLLNRLTGEQVYFTLLLGPETGCIKAEPGQLEQLLVNLVVNARDAMPQGGEVRVSTQCANVASSEAGALGVEPGDYVLVEVSDTGTGMDAETQAHIFEPFFTTKGPGKGTGLGLANCYGIVKQNGGFIRVQSELGRGTTFHIYFPRLAEAAPATATPKAPEALPRGHEAVLVVEDDDALRALTVNVLGELGYNVTAADDGEVAQQILKEPNAPVFDLVVSDVGMPRLDGVSLTHWLEAHHPETRVLLVSGYGAGLRQNDSVGNRAVLTKPFTRAQLASAVRQALEREGAATPASA